MKLIKAAIKNIPMYNSRWDKEMKGSTERFIRKAAELGLFIKEYPKGVITSLEEWA